MSKRSPAPQRTKILSLAAVAALTGTYGSMAAYAAERTLMIEEVIVTATKRSASMQDIPVAVQALTGKALEDMGIADFDDYMMQLPNVTAGGRGPGQASIYIRGMATDTFPVQLSGANGQSPNVALYLDEQPVSQPGRNLDVYITDVERIEVLAGPQGTLFGASSQAGTIRLITNKPDINSFAASVNTVASSTRHGEESYKVDGMINVPVIADKLALRGVFFTDHQGGYIDNVASTKTLSTDNPKIAGFDDISGITFLPANNAGLAEEDFNDTTYAGMRVSATWLINDEWDLLVSHMRQKLDSDGVFDYDPEIGDLKAARYSPDRLEEEWNNTAWTLNGRLGMLDVVYTGAFLDRDSEQVIDYTGYSDIGFYIPYYICDASVSYPGSGDPVGTCQAPNLMAQNTTHVEKWTHELRILTPQEKRWRVTAGIFYDDLTLEDRGDFIYPGSQFVQGYAPGEVGFPQNRPFPSATSIDPGFRDPGVVFFNDITRTEKQFALFGEFSYDLLPDTLEVTLGMRHYNIDVDLVGSANSSFSNLFNQEDVDAFGANLDDVLADFRPATEKGQIFKANLSWTPNNDMLFYATWSEGFRPGGMNRGCGNGNPTHGFVPCAYETDEVTNYEIGWKLNLMDNSLRFNGSAYLVKWSDMQTSVFNQDIYFLTFNDNAANSEVKGIDADFVWQASYNFSLTGAFSILDAKITSVKGSAINVAGPGSKLALAPSFQGNLRGRYEWDSANYGYHVQAALQYSSSSYSSIVTEPNNRFLQNEYAIASLSAGIRKDNWRTEIFVDNVTDTRADLFINTQDAAKRIFTNRPRTIGLRASYNY